MTRIGATKSQIQSSNTPRVIRTSSGRLHLLFLHGILEADWLYLALYHQYELDNTSWTQPQKVLSEFVYFSQDKFGIEKDDLGFAIYYFQGAFYKKVFDEEADRWLKPVTILGNSHIAAFLNLGAFSSVPKWRVHSHYLAEDGRLFIAWSISLDPSNESAKTYFVSSRDANGSLTHQSLPATMGGHFIRNESTLLFYGYQCSRRSVLLSNNTWSQWENLNSTRCQETPLWGTIFLNQYSFSYRNAVWKLQDLGENNHSIHLLPFPNATDLPSPLRGVDVELRRTSLPQDVALVISIFYETTIELWEYQFQSRNLILMNTVNVTKGPVSPIFGTNYFFNGDLITTMNDNWSLF